MSKSQRYLLDTHIFLWSIENEKKLKSQVREILEDPTIEVFVSTASFWEISIKHKIGKLPSKVRLSELVKKSSFGILNIDINHVIQLDELPPLHKDPFDRIIIAQAKAESLTLITVDQKLKQYNIKLLMH